MYVVLNVVATACINVDKEIWAELKAEHPDKCDAQIWDIYKEENIDNDDYAYSEYSEAFHDSLEVDDWQFCSVENYQMSLR